MNKMILVLMMICLSVVGQAQNEFGVKIDTIIRIDEDTAISSALLIKKLPTDPDFIISDTKWVNNIMDNWYYWDEFFAEHQITLYIYSHSKRGIDSLLVAKNAYNNFSFTKAGNKWFVRNFTIKAKDMTLNHVVCGQTSKEVFNTLHKKIKKQVGNGQVWLSNKNGSYCFILTFVDDKLISIQL